MEGFSPRWATFALRCAALLALCGVCVEASGQVPSLPASFDWRNVGGHSYIGPVRDQGSTSTCYAFAAAAAAEGAYNVAHGLCDGATVSFSESFIAYSYQQLYPADIWGNSGAGYSYRELAALRDIGVCSASAFPYSTSPPSDGNYHWDAPRTKIAQWYRLPVNDIETAQRALQTYGVLDVAVNTTTAFENYSGGVYTDSAISPDAAFEQYATTDHGVSLVGWNNLSGDGNGYWILRNSWGTDWGEDGYMRISFTSARVGCEMAYVRVGDWIGGDVVWNNVGPLTATPYTSDVGFPVARGFYAWGGTNSSAANSGDITAVVSGASGFAQAHGMYLWAEGDSRMSNSGTILAGAGSTDNMASSYGMLLQGCTLSNSGLITSAASAPAGYSATAYGMALFGYETGLVTNTGSVTATATGGDGRAYGIYAVRPDQVNNSGSILANGQTYGVGVTVAALDHGTVTNQSAGTIAATASGDGGSAIGINALRVTGLTNQGSITATGQGTGTQAYGVKVEGTGDQGESISLVNSGVISATSTDSKDAYSIYSNAYQTLLTLQTGSSLEGQVKLEGTDDVLQLEGTGSEDVALHGVETIVNAGNWTLSHLDSIDNMVLQSGTLTGRNMTLSGTLSGTGTLAGNSLSIHGTVSPGNSSIGTLTLAPTGTTTFASSSTLQIEVNGASATPVAGVNNDLVDVQGQAVVQGGTLDVQPREPFPTNVPLTYTFLHADGGLTVDSPWVFAQDWTFIDASLAYDATDYRLTLELLSYAIAAQTPNQVAVAHYLDNLRFVSDADLQSVLTSLDALSAEQAANAFDQMGSQLFGTLGVQSMGNTMAMLRTISEHLRARSNLRLDDALPLRSLSLDEGLVRGQCPGCACWRGWTGGYGYGGSVSSDGNAAGVKDSTGGGIVAVERELNGNVSLGLFHGYAFSHINLKGLDQGADASHFQFGSYLFYAQDDDYITLTGTLGPDKYDTYRRIRFDTLDRTARAEDHGWQGAVDLEAGRAYRWGAGMIQPYAGLQYVYLRQDSLQEVNAGTLNLLVDGRDADSLRSMLGLRLLSRLSPLGIGRSRWEARALWLHDFLDDPAGGVIARFVDIDTPTFVNSGLDLGRDTCDLGTGVDIHLSGQVTVLLNYDLQFNDRYAYHLGSASLEYLW